MNTLQSDTAPIAPDPIPSKQTGEEPLPGYRLLEPLGSGGFGEVWKCEAPGGLGKAIKFVGGRLDQLDGGGNARQELDALQRVKNIRHPFVLSMERVEVVGGELMIVMELADQNLHDVCRRHQAQGDPGIPRQQLLAYLLEAAEALDLMNFQHDLQHLDVKPRNLFLVSNHVKVADFGLVHGLQELADPNAARPQTALTPQYAAPEVFQGHVSRHSDQYSLAVVYQELLTGVHPFDGRNLRQLMMQHLMTPPDLEPLPPGDRPLVGKALAKDPDQRFASCLDFVNALVYASDSLADWMPPPAPPGPTANATPSPFARAALVLALNQSGPSSGRLRPPDLPAADQPPAPAPETARESGEQLPGYRFLECKHLSPLAEVWKVQDERGRQRLAQCLRFDARQAARLLARLRDLRHPGLHPREILPNEGGRVVVLEEPHRRTLREHHQECVNGKKPGVPREELLDLLGQAAGVLDHFAHQQVPHLGLHPRCLVVDEDGHVSLADLGLVALAWVPTNEPAGPLNPRYAAPELDRAGGTGAADQYSLAVIYAEMLTGVHPLRARSRGAGRGPVKPDLDLLSGADRAVVGRALDPDPGRRYGSCTEFLRALRRTAEQEGILRRERSLELPPVLPVAHLLGGSAVGGAVPAVADLAGHAIAAVAGLQQVGVFHNFRYRVHADRFLEHRCLVRMFPGALRLKLQGFHEQWKGLILHQDQTTFAYQITGRRSLWQACAGLQPGLEVNVRLEPAGADGQVLLAHFRVEPTGGAAGVKLFQDLGPEVLQSLRTCLHVGPEQRARERWAFDQPLVLYPVLSTLEVGGVTHARGKDLSPGDLGFFVEERPAAEMVYVQLGSLPPLADFAVLARVVRCRPCAAGFEVGAVFVGERGAGAA